MLYYAIDTEHPVHLPSGDAHLDGLLRIPKSAKGIVIFVHGSGSSRFSVRNQQVAHVLNQSGLATLLFDLLTPEEEMMDERTREWRFDIALLARRLVDVTHWCVRQLVTHELPVGYFGASTGGGAALLAAADLPTVVKAIVSRGGRPDLAADALARVKVPTLLIVGSLDKPVIELNKKAMDAMSLKEKKLEMVAGASHLFEEPGKLDEVANLARDWFLRYLPA